MSKSSELLALAKKRQATRWPGYNCIGDYHDGAYESDFVSPYTKTAGNIDADIMVMLQDWSSDQALREPLDEEAAKLGYTPSLRTNVNLVRLLEQHFGVALTDTYGTNLFPFVKPGGMSQGIRGHDMVRAACEFALPQIRIVRPRLVICLGVKTFNALRLACEFPACPNLDAAIDSPFDIDGSRVWCQAHTSALSQNPRGKQRVSQDWARMKRDYERPP